MRGCGSPRRSICRTSKRHIGRFRSALLACLADRYFYFASLILSAMQSSAVDPTTGQLDWDLVVTGHSARSRREHDLKKRALRDLIAGIDRPKLSRNELLQRFRDQSSEPIAEKDFAEILSDLDLEGLISIRGDVIRKLEKAA